MNDKHTFFGYTTEEPLRSSVALAADPAVRQQVEEQTRVQLLPGWEFHIDASGIGHLCLPNAGMSAVTLSVVNGDDYDLSNLQK